MNTRVSLFRRNDGKRQQIQLFGTFFILIPSGTHSSKMITNTATNHVIDKQQLRIHSLRGKIKNNFFKKFGQTLCRGSNIPLRLFSFWLSEEEPSRSDSCSNILRVSLLLSFPRVTNRSSSSSSPLLSQEVAVTGKGGVT